MVGPQIGPTTSVVSAATESPDVAGRLFAADRIVSIIAERKPA
jgi:hypothetical protein